MVLWARLDRTPTPLGPSFGAGTITGVAGWVDGNGYYHAGVSLTNGDVRDFAYGPKIGSPVWRTKTNFGATVFDIAGYNDYTNNRIVAQLSSPSTSIAVIQWAGLTGDATVGFATQSNFPTGCNISAASNVTAFDVGPYTGDDFMAWGTSSDHVCDMDFFTPFSGTQSNTAFSDWSFSATVQSISGFGEIVSNTIVPHVVTALSNSHVYDVYGSGAGAYLLGTF